MTLRNRATPTGEVVADPGRGLVFGNRGCLHDGEGRIVRRFNGKRWIACRLEFRGRYRGPDMLPGRYTPLFFLDEATAWAAGHRPCAECRRDDYVRFMRLWARVHGPVDGADGVDARLHPERVDARGGAAQRRHRSRVEDLPDGAFALHDGAPHVVVGSRMLRWTAGGYAAPVRRGRGEATVLTPPSLVAVLGAGWESSIPFLHPTAG